jgi:glycosyltransferase involved in cell wall biosynthesis
MATGKPSIVPGTGAMPETAGEAGLVYRPGDLQDLVRQIQRLRGDSGLYRELSMKASKRAPVFDIRTGMERYADLILSGRIDGEMAKKD